MREQKPERSRGTREAGMTLHPECSPGANYRNLRDKSLSTRANLNEALALTIKTAPLN